MKRGLLLVALLACLALYVRKHANQVADSFAQAKPAERLYKLIFPSSQLPFVLKAIDTMFGNSMSGVLGMLKLTQIQVSRGPTLKEPFFDEFAHKIKLLQGGELDVDKTLSNKVVLVTNVACGCGHTENNYAELNALRAAFPDKLEILGFPTNEFLQEQGTEEDIAKFVRDKNVLFPLVEKTLVNGPDAHPVYQKLKQSSGGSIEDDVLWNFETKFLVSKNGKQVQRFQKAFSTQDLFQHVQELVEE